MLLPKDKQQLRVTYDNEIQKTDTGKQLLKSGGKLSNTPRGGLLPHLTKANFKFQNILKDSGHFIESVKIIWYHTGKK